MDPDNKSWDIEKNLSYVMVRYWDSFTRVSMIVYGCLNTFLPILKIFNSCTTPPSPNFPHLFSLGGCQISSNFLKYREILQKIVKIVCDHIDCFYVEMISIS